MRRLIATPEGVETTSLTHVVVHYATRAHEAVVATEYTWPALPAHLRSMPDWRAMVRHWVRTDYHWTPRKKGA